MVLLLQTWQAASGNILGAGIARQPYFGQTEQSEEEVTSTSWKVLFAKTFSPETQDIVKQNVYSLVGQTFYILFAIKDYFFCNK